MLHEIYITQSHILDLAVYFRAKYITGEMAVSVLPTHWRAIQLLLNNSIQLVPFAAGVTVSTFALTFPCPLTLRLLMSYIYLEHPFLMFLDHTQRRSTVGRTPLDE